MYWKISSKNLEMSETEKSVFKQSKNIKITTQIEKSVALSRAFIVLLLKAKENISLFSGLELGALWKQVLQEKYC